MPLYDYQCRLCGGITEVFQRTMAAQVVTCSHCGAGDMEKLVSAPGAILKERSGEGGKTCCGSNERCDRPPCSTGDVCPKSG